jgi:steroid 5-alpha reductase family enzyme
MSPLQVTLAILGISIIISFVYGLLTRNYSTVDRLWSILPAIYVLVWMQDYMHNPRFVIAAIIVIAWALRLSLNFARRGGYAFNWKKGFTGEDYRWEILREKIPNRIIFELFNLVFISAFQLILVFLITLPLYFVGQVDAPLSYADYLLFGFHILFLTLEMIADNQQYKYYQERKSREFKNSPRHQLGFNTFGLWKHSRHPNYVCEMSQWVVVALYLFTLTGTWHYSMFGAAILILLFIGSTNMAESITLGKYEQYPAWRKVSVPWITIPGVNAKRKREFLKSIES